MRLSSLVLNSNNIDWLSPAIKVNIAGFKNVFDRSIGAESPSVNPPVILTGNSKLLSFFDPLTINLYLSPLIKYFHFSSFSSLFADLQTVDNLVRPLFVTHNLTSLTTKSVVTVNALTSVLLVIALLYLSKKNNSNLGVVEEGKVLCVVVDISLFPFLL